jgi:flagellar hook-length control protein FliK
MVDGPVIIEAAQLNIENKANTSLDKIEDGEKGGFSKLIKELLSDEKTSKKASESESLSKGDSRIVTRRVVMFDGKEVDLSKLFAAENDEETEGREKTARVKGGNKSAGELLFKGADRRDVALKSFEESEEKEKTAEGDEKTAKAEKSITLKPAEREVPFVEKKEDGRPETERAVKDRTPGARIVVIDLREHKEKHEPSVGQKQDKSFPDKIDSGKVYSLEEEGAARLFGRVESGEKSSSIFEHGKENLSPAGRQAAEKFQEALRNEVVKQSIFVLKDKGGGELRLVLRPESLGRVRINLNMNNNHIAGRIIVENSSVKEMFESNLQNLHEAFKNEGFASASLEVFVGGGNHREKKMEEEVPLHEAAAEFERNVPGLEEDISGYLIVNLTA